MQNSGGVNEIAKAYSLGKEISRGEASFSQERLWFLDRYDARESIAYNAQIAFTLQGNLDIDAFHKTLDEIFHRHDILRALFEEVEGKPVQVITAPGSFPIHHIDIRSTGEPSWSDDLDDILRDAVTTPFDLESGPLVRGYLVRQRDDFYVFLVVLHHIITDGWSNNIFRSEFALLYTAFVKDEAPMLQPPPAQYSDYTRW